MSVCVFVNLAMIHLSTNEFHNGRNGHKVERGSVAFVTLDLQACESACFYYTFLVYISFMKMYAKNFIFWHMPMLTT